MLRQQGSRGLSPKGSRWLRRLMRGGGRRRLRRWKQLTTAGLKQQFQFFLLQDFGNLNPTTPNTQTLEFELTVFRVLKPCRSVGLTCAAALPALLYQVAACTQACSCAAALL